MARRLADARRAACPASTITRPVQANAVFAILPPDVDRARCRSGSRFYVWDEATGEVRWMCSWDTTEADVDELSPRSAHPWRSRCSPHHQGYP